MPPDALFGSNARSACDIADGKLVEVADAAAQRRVATFLGQRGQGQSQIWLGATDLQEEGHFLFMTSNNQDAMQSFTNWAPGQPANDVTQNCVTLTRASGWAWQVTSCGYHVATACQQILRIDDDLVG